MTGPIVAIDIGRSGAGALFDQAGQLVDVGDLPFLHDNPASRPTINPALLAILLRRWPDRAELFARAKDHDRAEACLIGLTYITDAQRSAAA